MNYSLPPAVTAALRDKSVLVTGSAGFLGRHFCAAVEQCGGRISGYDIADGFDVSDRDMVPFGSMPDFIIHAAGTASPYHYRRNPLRALDAAVAGTRNMIDLAEDSGSRLLFLSSSEIYGDPLTVPTPETYRAHVETMGDRSSYDVSKCLGETLIHIASQRGVKANVVRLFNAYGPGMSEDDRRFMPELRRAHRTGRPVLIYGTGRQTRTFCYVTDTIRGCLQALTYGMHSKEPMPAGRVWNIGNDKPEITMPKLASMAGVRYELVPCPSDWPGGGEPNRRCPDISRARAELGYEPEVALADGLAMFLKDMPS